MARKLASIALGIAVLAAIGAVALKNHLREQRLLLERAQLEARLAHQRELSDQNRQMAAELRELGDLTKLRASSRQAEQMRSGIERIQLTLHNLDAHALKPGDPKPAPVWAEGAEVIDAKDWVDAGNKTARDAIESFLWASTSGDIDKIAGLIGFQPAAKEKAQALFDQLPDSAKTEYGTPEKIVATMIAASMPTDLQAASIQIQNNRKVAFVSLRDEYADSSQNDLVLRADNSTDGWKLSIPAKVIDAFQVKLAGTK